MGDIIKKYDAALKAMCLVEQKYSTAEVKKYSIKTTTNLEFSK